MIIKVLGTGCAKCQKLVEAVNEVVAEMNVKAAVVKEEDIVKIMQYGIMSTPGIVINEKVVVSGRLPGKDEIKQFIENS
ncbi:MAG: thioredoxin family protein [Bacteroidales bacterium]|nr:thioredoxin family protein [Bacteroidales bacterium]